MESIIQEDLEKKKRKNKDFQDLKQMMYGFGDDKTPLDETAELADEYLQEFLVHLAERAL